MELRQRQKEWLAFARMPKHPQVSPSGVATLLTLVVAGPLGYSCYYASVRLLRKCRKRKTRTELQPEPRPSLDTQDGVKQREQAPQATREIPHGLAW